MAAKKGAKKSVKKSAKKSAKKSTKKPSAKRTTVSPRADKRYVRRDTQGQFKESDDVGRSLGSDVKKRAKTTVKAGYGDQGDQE